ncbi:hypothetical protein CCOS191_3750 [Pseudomonas sp. CCOS 191]|nr:hypothetical protein CCOS191_3750 [Pseudomonas sp. CCOS 191]
MGSLRVYSVCKWQNIKFIKSFKAPHGWEAADEEFAL